MEFNSQRSTPGSEAFHLQIDACGTPDRSGKDIHTAIDEPRSNAQTHMHSKLYGIVLAIASHCGLHFFGIDVAITGQGECYVVDFNHLPNGVVSSSSFGDALADLVLERESLRRGKRCRE